MSWPSFVFNEVNDWALSEQQVEEEYYSNEADEILNSDTDPKLAKKRLKWENKIRAEDAAFAKKKLEIEHETENYKRKFRQEQFQISQMEIELKSKKTKLETLQTDIDAFLKRWLLKKNYVKMQLENSIF